MGKWRLTAVLLCSLIVATGCGDQRILEKQGFTHTISYDLVPKEEGKEEKLLVSITIPTADPEGGKAKIETLRALASSSKEARIKLSRQTELSVASGQLRNTLYGITIAKGIWEYMDTLVRDPSISQRVKLTVVNGSASEMLAKVYPSHPPTGPYIDRMLDKETQLNTVPKISLYEFTRDLFDDGIDPVVPIVKDKGTHIAVDGIALFKDDRYVAKVGADDALIFAFLRGRFKNGDVSIDLDDVGETGEYVFTSTSSARKVRIVGGKGGRLGAELIINIEGSVLEYVSGMDIGSTAEKHKAERLISHYIKVKAERVIQKMQTHHADNLGLGKHVRNSIGYKAWTKLNWEELYPQMDVSCKVNVEIKNYGKFEG